MSKVKILVLVEGAKTDTKLMRQLLKIYGMDDKHQIVSYNTNIYTLYREMFVNNEPENVDLLQMLKERESNAEKKKIFDEAYSDILLIFDLDPQDTAFTGDEIKIMMDYFRESSDAGKLYINYPMIEAFYHMEQIPDVKYNSYVVSLQMLKERKYKACVQAVNRNHDYTKFAVDRAECNAVIKQNIEKAFLITEEYDVRIGDLPDEIEVLNKQLKKLNEDNELYVLCTCVFYIAEYNSEFIYEN